MSTPHTCPERPCAACDAHVRDVARMRAGRVSAKAARDARIADGRKRKRERRQYGPR